MDWISALCLSVPLSLAALVAVWACRRAADERADRILATTDEALEVLRIASQAVADLVDFRRPRPDPGVAAPSEEEPFRAWVLRAGGNLPQEQVEHLRWAWRRLRGLDTHGNLDEARILAARFGMPVGEATEAR